MQMLRIGRLAAQAGVGIETVRFYERRGLVQPAARSANGYRLYGPDELRRVLMIRTAQTLGFTLREIKEVAGNQQRDPGCATLRSHVDAKLAELEQRISELEQTRRRLIALRQKCPGHSHEACPAVTNLIPSKQLDERARS